MRALTVLVVLPLMLYSGEADTVTETEPTCYSRYDYDHKLMKTLLTLEIKVDQLEIMVKQQETLVKQQETVINQQETVIKQQGTTIETINTELEGFKSTPEKLKQQESLIGGQTSAMYVHWGRSSCPGNGTELVYEGYAGGAHYTHTGGPANSICLPKDPTWTHYIDGQSGGSPIYGSEYEFGSTSSQLFGSSLHDQDVPCAVCKTNRASVLMIPARNQCYDGWTLEYHGYLVAGHQSHVAASETVCKAISDGASNQNGKLFYLTEAKCGSLRCPPYVEGRELTCVVCSY